jgi:hypothetical protein
MQKAPEVATKGDFYLKYFSVASSLKDLERCKALALKIDPILYNPNEKWFGRFDRMADYADLKIKCGMQKPIEQEKILAKMIPDLKAKLIENLNSLKKKLATVDSNVSKFIKDHEVAIEAIDNCNCSIYEKLSAIEKLLRDDSLFFENLKVIKNECGKLVEAYIKDSRYGCTELVSSGFKYSQFGKTDDQAFYLIYKLDLQSFSNILQQIIFSNSQINKIYQVFEVEKDNIYPFEDYQELGLESTDCNGDKLDDLKLSFQENSAKGAYGLSYCWLYDPKLKLFKPEHGEVIDEGNDE